MTKDTTYDLTSYATKEELEKVKGMIDVSARIVGSGVCQQSFDGVTDDKSKTATFNFQLPECDYVEIQPLHVDFPYASAVTSDTAVVSTALVTIMPPKVILVRGGNAALVGVRCDYSYNGRSGTYVSGKSTTLTSSCSLTGTIEYSSKEIYDINWYYVCYKYDS